jgi:hypothetical protein
MAVVPKNEESSAVIAKDTMPSGESEGSLSYTYIAISWVVFRNQSFRLQCPDRGYHIILKLT